jgi:hypothetical protein
MCIFTVKPGKGKGKSKETSANSTTAGTGVTILSEKKLFLGQKVRFCWPLKQLTLVVLVRDLRFKIETEIRYITLTENLLKEFA